MKGSTSSRSKNSHFATTHWSVVLAASSASSTDYRNALSSLCETYWFPIYAYLRKLGYTVHHAEDHTQEFFTILMEKQGFHSINPNKGKFRSYLLGALKHYLADARDRANAKKRGGEFKIVSLDLMHCENQLSLESKNGLSPEQQYHRSWALALLQRAINRIKSESNRSDKPHVFDHIIQYLIPFRDKDQVPYREAAADLGMSEAALKAAIYRLRKRYRELLMDEIINTVADENMVEEEIQSLIEALSL